MRKGILIWSGAKTGARENVPPRGGPLFESLEPRLLMNADLAGVQPVLSHDVVPADQAIYVDLDHQDTKKPEELSPILTLEALPCDETSRPRTEQENTSFPEVEQAQRGVLAEVSLGDSQVGLHKNSAESVIPAQRDDVSTPSDALPIAIRGPPAGTQGQQAVELFNVSPALFVENQGQWSDPSVRYIHDGNGVDVAITDAGLLFRATGTDVQTLQFSASFVGANLVRPVGLERSPAVFNYCVGEQANWRQNVPSYEVVTYEGLYEGIGLRIQGLRSHLKYEFHVAPGADYGRIAVRYEGIEGLSLGEDGSLEVNLGAGRGVIRDDAPYIYQEIDGRKVEVAGRFILLDDRTYAFEVTGDIDPDRVLVIDPDLVWSTYLGGSADDWGYGIAVDTSGNILVTGTTSSSGWMNGGFNTTYNGGAEDAFVAKLSLAGEPLWSTYLGGSADDYGYGIALDPSGNVYVTGGTGSSGWTSGGFDTTFNGRDDAFVAKLGSDGAHLWSTYLGGGNDDRGYGIAVDDSGDVYVTGETTSSGWVSGGADTIFGTGDDPVGRADAFVVKLSFSGAHLWSTYLGGSKQDRGTGIAVDASNSVYVTGWTWPITLSSEYATFVTKLSSSGAYLWSTYLGEGIDDNRGGGIAVDASNSVYVTGWTYVYRTVGWVSGGFDTTYNGGLSDAFVAKLSSGGEHLWSTYLGGGGEDRGYGIAVDASGDVYVTGSTGSSGWTSGGFDTSYNGGGDGFVVRLSSSGAHLSSTYLGGSGTEYGYGIAVDASDNVCVTGYTTSSGWTSRGFDTTYNGGSNDAFVAKLTAVPDTTPPNPNPSTWATEPYATGPTSIRMVATTATDAMGVEYFFDEISGNPGATDSGWQDSDTYEDTGLSPSTTYIYQVKTRDQAINHNETGYSLSRWATTQPPDTTPPSPNPSTWATEPYATGPTSIRMIATTTSDPGGVQYYFHCLTSGGHDSGWQDGSAYEDLGLLPSTTYTYQVKSRDQSTNLNETDYSTARSAATQPDTTPPSPDPSTWATEPYATGPTSIRMVATTATDISGVEYYFQETSGNPGGTDSGWQGSNTYEDLGLLPSMTYTYQVKARDGSAAYNETSYSTARSATTPADTTPPSPNPSTWATEPYATGSTSIRMVATVATDARGVEYYFHETSGSPGATDSGWQDSNTYEDTGLSPNTTYVYQVKSRDKATNPNETGYSTACLVTTPAPGMMPPSPNPSTWATEPYATGTASIEMIATTASDDSGVQYYFHCSTSGGHDSGWQDDAAYEDTGLSPGTSYAYRVKTRDNSSNHNEGTYSTSSSATTPSPVYRFWSPVLSRHFYTISETERDKLINNYSHVWTYEGPAYSAFADSNQPGTLPIYRFWSGTLNAHFYTMSESEKNKLIDNYSNVWTYEKIAFYAYAAGSRPLETSAVYRLWSGTLNCHFFTISQTEKDKLVNLYSHVWTYEKIAWYAYTA